MTVSGKVAEPKDDLRKGYEVHVSEVDAVLRDGSHVEIPGHSFWAIGEYPRILASTHPLTHENLPNLLEIVRGAAEQNFSYPTLAQDEAMRDQYGMDESTDKGRTMFDACFGRNGESEVMSFVADFTRCCEGRAVKGVRGQKLIKRLVGYRLPDREIKLGVTAIAPSGMVPLFTRKVFESRYGAKSLNILEKLGVDIPGNENCVVKPVNALGYPQFTLYHDAKDSDGKLIPHQYHFITPKKGSLETVGIRGTIEHGKKGKQCFIVYMVGSPKYSGLDNDVSFPLIYAGGVEIRVNEPKLRAAII